MDKDMLWKWLTGMAVCSHYTCSYCKQTCGLTTDDPCPKYVMEKYENSVGKSIYQILADCIDHYDGRNISDEDIAAVIDNILP